MKRFLLTILVGFLSLLGGIWLGVRFEEMRHAQKDMEEMLRSERREQHYATVVGLGVLDTLETGNTDKAKSLLAQELAVYHYSFRDREASLPESQRLVPQIEAVSARSPILKEELQKQRK